MRKKTAADYLPGRPTKQGSPLDMALSRIHRAVFATHPLASVIVAIAVYVAIVLLAGKRLAISGNYFVIIPVVAAALAFELPGGIIAGILGLPANLFLFFLLGHPEFSPASKPIAELSGIIIGTTLGYLSDFFSKLQAEIRRRVATEESLRRALAEKDLLLKELHHRVRNNLNVIKSLIQLQKNRSSNPEFLKEIDDLLGRVFAMALIHEQLYSHEDLLLVNLPPYIDSLATNVASALQVEAKRIRIDRALGGQGMRMTVDSATPLGLIVNESLTNAIKHAFAGVDEPRIAITLAEEEGRCVLRVEDNGVGFPSEPPGGDADKARSSGLGLTLMEALAGQLDGSIRYSPVRPGEKFPGARVELVFPRERVQANGTTPVGR
jgi:two-component sensor histidine kinase